MTIDEMKDVSRNLEDLSEMSKNMQEKNALMKIAQKEKENHSYIKQLMER